MHIHPVPDRPSRHGLARAAALAACLGAAPALHAQPAPDSLGLARALEHAERHPAVEAARAAVAGERAVAEAVPGRLLAPELEGELARGGESFGSSEHQELGVGVSQRVPLGGRRRHAAELARARVAVAEAALAATLREVRRAIAAAWRAAAFEQRRLAELDPLAELDRELVEAIRRRVRDESVTPLSGRLTELDWLEVESRRLEARGRLERARLALAAAMGLEADALPARLAAAGFAAPDSLAEPDIARSLARRAERELKARELDVARAEATLAGASTRPDLTLGVGLAWERSRIAGEDFSGDPAVVGGIEGIESRDRVWRVRASVPIGAEPEALAERARARGAVPVREAELRRADLAAGAAARTAWARLREAHARLALVRPRAGRVRADLGLVRDAWRDGRITLETYLADKARLVGTLIATLEAEQDYWEAHAEVEAALDLDPETGAPR